MHVLLIEDDVRIVNFIKRGLEAKGYAVDAAYDGQEGLDKGVERYDLIILDVLLPVRSGVEICQTLRREKVTTPILMLTARDSLKDKIQGFEAGADDYLTKPFAFEELLARIKALLRRGAYQELAIESTVADLTLNRETREVKRGEKQISLTAKEFALLEHLMSHVNKPVSRTAILEHVWGYDYDTLTNVVDVYIGYLRKKVDHGFSKALIHTVRDVGYKISDSTN